MWHWDVFWLTTLFKHTSHYFFLSCSTADLSPNYDVNSLETTNVKEEENKVYQEYAAAQDYEGIYKYEFIFT